LILWGENKQFMLEKAPSIPQGGSFEVYKIIEFVNSEYLEILNTQAPSIPQGGSFESVQNN
jgi:hypothetical protein